MLAGCSLLSENLRQIGFKLSIGDVERRLVRRGIIVNNLSLSLVSG